VSDRKSYDCCHPDRNFVNQLYLLMNC